VVLIHQTHVRRIAKGMMYLGLRSVISESLEVEESRIRRRSELQEFFACGAARPIYIHPIKIPSIPSPERHIAEYIYKRI
jgi:hypothetical protein